MIWLACLCYREYTVGIYYAASVDDGAVDQHHQPVGNENIKLFPGFQVMNKNITVMEEVS